MSTSSNSSNCDDAPLVTISRLHELPADRFADLVTESERAGHRFVRRLVEDWESGVNRFHRPGEALFAAEVCGRMVGVCGLNIDPYAPQQRVGRVRHLYVSAAHRHRGIGRRLVQQVIASAHGGFDRLRLRTESAAAARFYEACCFSRCTAEPDCTHVMELQERGLVPHS